MTEDILKKMSGALAQRHSGATPAPEATRARITRTLGERRPPRGKWLTFGIPVFVLLGGSTAWAAATGELPEIVERTIALVIDPFQEGAPSLTQPSTGTTEETTDLVDDQIERTPPVNGHQDVDRDKAPVTQEKYAASPGELSIHSQPDEATRTNDPEEREKRALSPATNVAFPAPKISTRAKTEIAEAGIVGKQSAAPPVADDAAIFTYQGAHRAHFQGGNCLEAIVGYEQYLHDTPNGTFALEAKYNRAVCLARLKKISEAINALTPFAHGTHGNYRKEESRALMKALSERHPEKL